MQTPDCSGSAPSGLPGLASVGDAMRGDEARGLLHPFLLLLICERPGHGYDLIVRLGLMGVTGIESGRVYRILRALEKDRAVNSMWVTSPSGPARRRYEITPKGREDLRGWLDVLGRLREMLEDCHARWDEVSRMSDRQ